MGPHQRLASVFEISGFRTRDSRALLACGTDCHMRCESTVVPTTPGDGLEAELCPQPIIANRCQCDLPKSPLCDNRRLQARVKWIFINRSQHLFADAVEARRADFQPLLRWSTLGRNGASPAFDVTFDIPGFRTRDSRALLACGTDCHMRCESNVDFGLKWGLTRVWRRFLRF